MFAITVPLLLIGILTMWTMQSRIRYTLVALAMAWRLVFSMAVGQLGLSTPAEVRSTRVKMMFIARLAF
jgi:SP family general alpha glucoside:H+ symporter-like MFS transporter